MWANRKESSRVLVKLLGAGAYAVLESGGTALFSLKMRKLKVDLIPAFHYLKGRRLRVRLLSLLSPLAVELAITKEKTVTSYSRRKSDGTLGRGGGGGVGWAGGVKVVEWKPMETVKLHGARP